MDQELKSNDNQLLINSPTSLCKISRLAALVRNEKKGRRNAGIVFRLWQQQRRKKRKNKGQGNHEQERWTMDDSQ